DFAPIAPMKLCPAFPRGTDKGDRETRVVSHCYQCRFAVARVTFESYASGIDGFVGLEIIERAADAPCPGAQRAPIIQFPRLAFVDETDDTFGQACAVVSLNTCGHESRVGPTLFEDLLLPGRATGWRQSAGGIIGSER